MTACRLHADREQGFFSQERPNRICSPTERDARWHGTKTTRRIALEEQMAMQNVTIIPCLTAKTPYAGDLRIGWHNTRSGRLPGDPVARTDQLSRYFSQGEIWNICEQNQDSETIQRWIAGNTNPRVPHYTWWTEPPINQNQKEQSQGAGVALFVPKKFCDAPKQSQYAYRCPNGKAMAVNITLKGQAFLLITVHGPHYDRDHEAYWKRLKANIQPPPTGTIPLVGGDFNFIPSPSVDSLPAQDKQQYPRAVESCAAFLRHIGVNHNGMVDAFRCVHGMQPVATHFHPGNKANQRLDRAYIPPTFTEQNAPCMRTMEHIPREDLAILDKKGTLKKSDHHAVQITIRFTNIKKPPKQWSYKSPSTPEDLQQIQQKVTSTANHANNSRKSAEETMSDIQEMTKITCRAMDRENNLQTYKQRAKLMARLKTIEKTYPTTPSQRKQYMAKMNR